MSQAQGLLAPKIKVSQISKSTCLCGSGKRSGGFKHMRTISLSLSSFSQFQARWGKRNATKTYLPSVYPAAMVTLTCRFPCSENIRGNKRKRRWGWEGEGGGGGGGGRKGGAKCGGYTFTSGKGHLYFRLTKFERS